MSIPPFESISELLLKEEACIDFLMSKGSVYGQPKCWRCKKDMSLHNGKKSWICRHRSCQNNAQRSIFQGSLFSNSKLSCNKVMMLAYLWLIGARSSTAQLFSGCSSATITQYYAQFGDMVADYMEDHQEMVGGPGIIVEIDESKFGKRKYHRGHLVKGAWVFGGVERTPERKVFAKVVENRTEDTLLEAIRQNIHPESIIYSDMWKGYKNIKSKLGMQHETVNHSKNMKDPVTGVHTNTIEGTWNGFKLGTPARKRVEQGLDEHLWSLIWKRLNKDKLWDSLLDCLADTAFSSEKK